MSEHEQIIDKRKKISLFDEIVSSASAFPAGRPVAALIAEHYDSLRKLARAYSPPGGTLTPTAIVNELFLEPPDRSVRNTRHFFALMCTAMRFIRRDYDRAKNAQKRGGGKRNISQDELGLDLPASSEADPVSDELNNEMVVAFFSALLTDEERSVVTLRKVLGLKFAEVARVLGISEAGAESKYGRAVRLLAKFKEQ